MTNEEAQLVIADSESKLRKSRLSAPLAGWSLTTLSGICGCIGLASGWGVPLLAIAGGIGLWSVYTTEGTFNDLQEFKNQKTLHLWQMISRSEDFGLPIKGLALEIRDIVKEICTVEAGEFLLPLAQAVRIFDVCILQQKQLNSINAQLCRLYTLRQPFTVKTAQLTALREARTKSPEEEQLDDEINKAEAARSQIESSCYRLKNIVEEISRKAQAQKFRRELDQLSAQLPRQTQSVEPAFEAESLEEIERQIGREIETYLQLERETDEHLR